MSRYDGIQPCVCNRWQVSGYLSACLVVGGGGLSSQIWALTYSDRYSCSLDMPQGREEAVTVGDRGCGVCGQLQLKLESMTNTLTALWKRDCQITEFEALSAPKKRDPQRKEAMG